MLSIYEVIKLCDENSKIREWLRGYGVVRNPPSECAKFGSWLRASECRGKPGLVCANQKCRVRVYGVVGGLLEGPKLSMKEFVFLAYCWAHDCAGNRAVHMLGYGSETKALGSF